MPLVVEGLWKRYGRVEAVKGISFTVEPGRVVGLVGPNGAGKTTTIKCILGLVRPTAGRVLVDGESVESPRARRLLGYVPELPDAPGWMTPRELLAYLGELEGLRGGELSRRVEELLGEWGLREYADRRISGLSKGTRKRVLIAQSLLNMGEKRYILMDEPMSGLDPVWVERLRSLVRSLKSSGVGVLISSHLLRELEGLVDDVVVIVGGRVVFSGSLGDMARLGRGEVVEARVSDPERAASLVRGSGLASSVEVEGDLVRIRLREGVRASEVLRVLEEGGVEVKTFEAKQVSLEEVYRRLVGGGGA